MGEQQAVIELRVTADHIAAGTRLDTGACPIALAFKEAVPGVDPASVDVGDDGVYWTDEGGVAWHADLPAEGHRFIGAFDGRNGVAPIVLELVPRVTTGEDTNDDDLDDLDVELDDDEDFDGDDEDAPDA